MKNIPTTRIVFNRKHEATKTKSAIVQIEILYNGKRTYVSTGVKVCLGQFVEGHVARRDDMTELNERIAAVKGRIDEYLTTLIGSGISFSADALKAHLAGSATEGASFIDWAAERIATRADIEDSSRKTQKKLIPALLEFGRIVGFSDLTRANIVAFDDWLHGKGLKQTTVWSYHKMLKTYIHEAIKQELIDKDPYIGFKVERGKSEWGRYLTLEELDVIECVELPTESLRRVRDMFLVQCHTGLSFADLVQADFSRVKEIEGVKVLSGDRQKTGVGFTTVLDDKVVEIVGRYGGALPRMSNQQYNMRLKVVADIAGINKPIASHWGRRTCGMVLLNEGVPIEVVAKVLGHSNIKTTQEAYAKVLDETVVKALVGRRKS